MYGQLLNPPVPLQTWFKENILNNDAGAEHYGGRGQVLFVRDHLAPMMWYQSVSTYKSAWDWGEEHLVVVGTHTSKSNLLPVYEFTIFHSNQAWVTVTMRENFFGWVVGISCGVDIPQLIFEQMHYNVFAIQGSDYGNEGKFSQHYAEGFPEYPLYGPPARYARQKQWTLRIGDNYSLFAYMMILKAYLREMA